MEPTVEVVYGEKSVLGEGPVYDESNNQLVWVDIEGSAINFLDLSTRKNRSVATNNLVGAAVPCRSGKRLVASIGKSVCLVDKETGAAKEIASVEPDKSNNRINDSKCDRKGRYWFGTMAFADPVTGMSLPKQGSFYRLDGAGSKHLFADVTVSNGIEFSLDWTKLYHVDSGTRQISCFDYNEENGNISNRRIIIDFKDDKSHGFPDGMTIDSEGKLWIAEFFGSCVCRWDPDTGEMLQRVPIPAPKITSCCFGGPDYSVLYVTSASVGSTEEELKKSPKSGNIFAVSNLGVKGLPPQFFNDSMYN